MAAKEAGRGYFQVVMAETACFKAIAAFRRLRLFHVFGQLFCLVRNCSVNLSEIKFGRQDKPKHLFQPDYELVLR